MQMSFKLDPLVASLTALMQVHTPADDPSVWSAAGPVFGVMVDPLPRSQLKLSVVSCV